jgi:PhnB protein
VRSLRGGLHRVYDVHVMAKATDPLPSGFHTLTPHLTVKGAADYIDFLKRAFNAVEIARSPGPGGKLMHALMTIGDSRLMLNDHFPEMGAPDIAAGFWPVILNLYVPDADAIFAQATAAGCEVVMPLADQFWGDRYGQLRDPFGFRWAVATHIEDLTPAELQERQTKLFGGGGV